MPTVRAISLTGVWVALGNRVFWRVWLLSVLRVPDDVFWKSWSFGLNRGTSPPKRRQSTVGIRTKGPYWSQGALASNVFCFLRQLCLDVLVKVKFRLRVPTPPFASSGEEVFDRKKGVARESTKFHHGQALHRRAMMETFGGGDLTGTVRSCLDSSRHGLRRRDLVVVVELGCM